jgi:proton glutamate symport protein
MYALPFGLCCLFASQISQVGINVFLALIKFVVLIYASSCLMLIIYSIIISLKKKVSIFQSFSALRETLIVALGTSSSFAAIPSALNCLTENLKIDKGTTNIVVPLGVSLNPHGSVLHFAISTVFVAQVYGASLGPQGLLITLVGSVFAGMAATGVPGGGSLSMLAIIFGPLGLPLQAALVFFIAIDPIIDPILTVVTMHANCAATALSETNKK